jgi:hypothetical protein
LNADDFLYPAAIQTARSVFDESPDVDVVAGHSAVTDHYGRMRGYHWAVEPPGENLRWGCVISQPSCFFRRAALQAAGGIDPSLHYTMDWDLWLRMLEAGAMFKFIERPLSAVYWGVGTKTLGWGAARRAELERLIQRYVPSNRRTRVRMGFALRAMFDRLGLKDFESALRPDAPAVFGIGPHGRLRRRAIIYWTHFEPFAKRSLRLQVSNTDVVRLTDVDQLYQPNQSSRRCIQIDFANPIEAATVVRAEIAVESQSDARLIACEWI